MLPISPVLAGVSLSPGMANPCSALRRIGRFTLFATASSAKVSPAAPQLMWKYTAALEWSKEAGLKRR
jgi:hypothetical protein